MRKLNIYGISGSFFRIVEQIFTNRKQLVKYDNKFSDPLNVTSGVLQGGVILPTFFNVYIADITKFIKSQIFKFADDILLMRPIYDKSDFDILQKDLDYIHGF